MPGNQNVSLYQSTCCLKDISEIQSGKYPPHRACDVSFCQTSVPFPMPILFDTSTVDAVSDLGELFKYNTIQTIII